MAFRSLLSNSSIGRERTFPPWPLIVFTLDTKQIKSTKCFFIELESMSKYKIVADGRAKQQGALRG